MSHPSAALVVAALMLGLTSCRREESKVVWSGLVIATNVSSPTPIPNEFSWLEGTFKGIFGYNQFQVIGQSRKVLQTGQEDWLAKSNYFALHVDSKGATRDSYLLNLKLFQQDKLLLETDAKLSKSSPLVIKGPQVGDGLLVLVLVIE